MKPCTPPAGPQQRIIRSLDDAASFILTQHAAALPDLSGCVVAVANHRAGRDFAAALMRATGLATLIPPTVVPLTRWAQSVGPTPEAPMRRLTRLATVLRRASWLGEVDRWQLASELLNLIDALSAVRPAGALGLAGQAVSREVALIETVWRVLNSDGRDPQACYAQGLQARLATRRPLYLLAPGPLTPLETRFLDAYSAFAPVFTLHLEPDTPAAQVLASAWQTDTPPLAERARALHAIWPTSPLTAFDVVAATDLETGARAVATWVAARLNHARLNHAQLNQQRSRIALIALDRLTARRARALLERLDVHVADETGWMLSTTAAAALIDRWLTCLAQDFPHGDLLDVLQSPFWGTLAARQDAVLALDLALRRHSVAHGQAAIRSVAQTLGPAVPAVLEPLFDAARTFARTRAPLALWLRRLQTSLHHLDAVGVLDADAAGAQLWQVLESTAQALADDTERYDFAGWRRWLDLLLESTPFTDPAIDSPLVLTSLPAARGRQFDAVALIGMDAGRLPARPPPGLFSQAVCATLGLPLAHEAAAHSVADLIALIADVPTLITWQAFDGGEPCAPSPLLVRLQTLHQAAWQSPLARLDIGTPPTRPSVLPAPARAPQPVVAAAHLPRMISPSAYQTLLDCPYRFFAERVLGLRLLEDADEPLDKRDYGNLLHTILQRFHDADPPPQRDAALAQLAQVSELAFATLPPYVAAAWRARWQPRQPDYIDAWLGMHAEGWRYQAGEQQLEANLPVAGLGDITLAGRIDRLDRRSDNQLGDAHRIIDYKTSALATLRAKNAHPDEAVQLAAYAWLGQAEAAFLPLDDTPTLLRLDGETDIEAIVLRLPQLLAELAGGAPLVANGSDAVCRHCDARGLCRKGHTPPADALRDARTTG